MRRSPLDVCLGVALVVLGCDSATPPMEDSSVGDDAAVGGEYPRSSIRASLFTAGGANRSP